jgi:hypothetical protein
VKGYIFGTTIARQNIGRAVVQCGRSSIRWHYARAMGRLYCLAVAWVDKLQDAVRAFS